MTSKKLQVLEESALAARPCLDSIPYRMVVFKEKNHHGKPLYLVAGSPAPACGAEKALRAAHKVHGGSCFYCKNAVPHAELTIDHAEPRAAGGASDIQNLLIACRPCNTGKRGERIEFYHPDAGREWLSAVLRHVQDRLNRLG